MVAEVHEDDGIDPSRLKGRERRSGKRVKDRKMRALCSQVERTIAMSMPANLDLVPVAASEGADPSTIIVMFQRTSPRVSLTDATSKLEAARSYFTEEVASAITRKKVPTLVFRVSPEILYPEG